MSKKEQSKVSPYVYIGYRCNNNCIFCSEADEHMKSLKPKSTEQIKKEISKTRNYYNFINFMGREPTLREDFIELLKITKKLNFEQVGFTTNGRLLAYKDFTQKVLEAGVNQIVISLNGATSETHDNQTQVKGSFFQTIKGIRNVIELKNRKFSLIVNLLLNKMNYLELPQMISLVKDLGVREINILNAAPLSRRSCNKKIIMRMSDLSSYIVEVLKEYKDDSELKFLLVEFGFLYVRIVHIGMIVMEFSKVILIYMGLKSLNYKFLL
jgi:MoaA/NifB/PqqE/SkfB family radical SAM enzyme